MAAEAERYDRGLIDLAAEKSGIKAEVLEKADEMPTNPFFMPYIPSAIPGTDSGSMNDRLFMIQSNIIRDIAGKERAVFVGAAPIRCCMTGTMY